MASSVALSGGGAASDLLRCSGNGIVGGGFPLKSLGRSRMGTTSTARRRSWSPTARPTLCIAWNLVGPLRNPSSTRPSLPSLASRLPASALEAAKAMAGRARFWRLKEHGKTGRTDQKQGGSKLKLWKRQMHAYKAQKVRELEEQQGHPCTSQQLAKIDDDAVIHVMGRDSHRRLRYMGNHMNPNTYYRSHHPSTGSNQTTPTATTSTSVLT